VTETVTKTVTGTVTETVTGPAAEPPAAVPRPRLLPGAMALVCVVAVASALLGIGVRATFGGHAAVDEPQYLLTALSLAEDGNLDIADELRDQRWRAFFDEELPVQTQVLPDGRQLSPHDPLLAVLLAVPMGLGGFLAAKAFLGVLAGLTAALVLWVAVRRFGVPLGLATTGVAVAFASPPLAIYGQQVYPELPAALAVTAAVAALTGRLGRGGLVALVLAVTALPWLGVKFAPVAAALAIAGLVRLLASRRTVATASVAGALAASGVAYLAIHRLGWGGWTVYATGDHFVGTGEFSVVGVTPDYVGRSLRLVALLVDRGYGIGAWQPAWLLAVPAFVALLVLRPRWWATLALPLAAGWLVATFVALTMNGFWWPGRQVVVVLPLVLLLVLWWLAHSGVGVRLGALALGFVGVVALACLLVDGWAREITWVSGFEAVDDPAYQLIRHAMPDYRAGWLHFWPAHLAWIGIFAALVVAAWWSAGQRRLAGQPAGVSYNRKGRSR
jgi:hypothetical protein